MAMSPGGFSLRRVKRTDKQDQDKENRAEFPSPFSSRKKALGGRGLGAADQQSSPMRFPNQVLGSHLTGDLETTPIPHEKQKKRKVSQGRRVSFADTLTVHEFTRDEDYEIYELPVEKIEVADSSDKETTSRTIPSPLIKKQKEQEDIALSAPTVALSSIEENGRAQPCTGASNDTAVSPGMRHEIEAASLNFLDTISLEDESGTKEEEPVPDMSPFRSPREQELLNSPAISKNEDSLEKVGPVDMRLFNPLQDQGDEMFAEDDTTQMNLTFSEQGEITRMIPRFEDLLAAYDEDTTIEISRGLEPGLRRKSAGRHEKTSRTFQEEEVQPVLHAASRQSHPEALESSQIGDVGIVKNVPSARSGDDRTTQIQPPDDVLLPAYRQAQILPTSDCVDKGADIERTDDSQLIGYQAEREGASQQLQDGRHAHYAHQGKCEHAPVHDDDKTSKNLDEGSTLAKLLEGEPLCVSRSQSSEDYPEQFWDSTRTIAAVTSNSLLAQDDEVSLNLLEHLSSNYATEASQIKCHGIRASDTELTGEYEAATAQLLQDHKKDLFSGKQLQVLKETVRKLYEKVESERSVLVCGGTIPLHLGTTLNNQKQPLEEEKLTTIRKASRLQGAVAIWNFWATCRQRMLQSSKDDCEKLEEKMSTLHRSRQQWEKFHSPGCLSRLEEMVSTKERKLLEIQERRRSLQEEHHTRKSNIDQQVREVQTRLRRERPELDVLVEHVEKNKQVLQEENGKLGEEETELRHLRKLTGISKEAVLEPVIGLLPSLQAWTVRNDVVDVESPKLTLDFQGCVEICFKEERGEKDKSIRQTWNVNQAALEKTYPNMGAAALFPDNSISTSAERALTSVPHALQMAELQIGRAFDLLKELQDCKSKFQKLGLVRLTLPSDSSGPQASLTFLDMNKNMKITSNVCLAPPLMGGASFGPMLHTAEAKCGGSSGGLKSRKIQIIDLGKIDVAPGFLRMERLCKAMQDLLDGF